MDVTIQHLRVVLAVADTGSFTGAGELLGLGQSTLSRTVAEVERRVGVRLFERTTRLVTPTREGTELIGLAQEMVAGFDRGLAHMQGFLDGSRGVVRVATLPSLAAILLPPLVSSYAKEHPEVRVEVEDGLLGQVVEQVRSGAADLAVTVPPEPDDRLVFHPLAEDTFHAVFPTGDELGDEGQVGWSRFEGRPFIRFHPSSSVSDHVDRALTEEQVRTGPTTEVRNIAVVGGLVAAGLGVSAVPSLVLPLLAFGDLDHRPLRSPVVSRRIGILLDRERPLTPATRGFLEALSGDHDTRAPLPDGARWVARRAARPARRAARG